MTMINLPEARAIARIGEAYEGKGVMLDITEFRDEGDIGWTHLCVSYRQASSRQPVASFHYVVSPTGRAWRSNKDRERVTELFDATYETQGV